MFGFISPVLLSQTGTAGPYLFMQKGDPKIKWDWQHHVVHPTELQKKMPRMPGERNNSEVISRNHEKFHTGGFFQLSQRVKDEHVWGVGTFVGAYGIMSSLNDEGRPAASVGPFSQNEPIVYKLNPDYQEGSWNVRSATTDLITFLRLFSLVRAARCGNTVRGEGAILINIEVPRHFVDQHVDEAEILEKKAEEYMVENPQSPPALPNPQLSLELPTFFRGGSVQGVSSMETAYTMSFTLFQNGQSFPVTVEGTVWCPTLPSGGIVAPAPLASPRPSTGPNPSESSASNISTSSQPANTGVKKAGGH